MPNKTKKGYPRPKNPAIEAEYENYDLFDLDDWESRLVRYFVRSRQREMDSWRKEKTIFNKEEMKYIADHSNIWIGTIEEVLHENIESAIISLRQHIHKTLSYTDKQTSHTYQTDHEKRIEVYYNNTIDYINVNDYINGHKYDYDEFVLFDMTFCVQFSYPPTEGNNDSTISGE